MDTAVIIAIIAVAVSALSVGITLIVLVVRGGFLLGRLVAQVEAIGNQVQGLAAAVSELRADGQRSNQTLTAAINELRAEVQQSNQTLAALANHTHDTDGRTMFQVPPATGR